MEVNKKRLEMLIDLHVSCCQKTSEEQDGFSFLSSSFCRTWAEPSTMKPFVLFTPDHVDGSLQSIPNTYLQLEVYPRVSEQSHSWPRCDSLEVYPTLGCPKPLRCTHGRKTDGSEIQRTYYKEHTELVHLCSI